MWCSRERERERERERGVLAYNLRESERWVGVD